MERKAVSGIMLILLLIGILALLSDIQSAKASGTIYIRPDGSVDPPTTPIQHVGDVYIFTDNINESIIVEKDTIVIDGNSYVLQGIVENRIGIDLSDRKNVTVMNVYVSNFSYAIWLHNSNNITLINNTLAKGDYGIGIWDSHHNVLMNNTATNNSEYAFFLESSSHNILSNNKILDNFMGIEILWGTRNTLRNNVIVGNKYSIDIGHYELSYYLHDVDSSNTVNGKPVYYWLNRSNETIPLDAGCVYIVNSTGITVENLTLTDNFAGVTLGFSTKCSVKNVTTMYNMYGFWLEAGRQNVLAGNNASNNAEGGFFLVDSSNNLLMNNVAVNNTGLGIVGGAGGIYLEDTTSEVLRNNTLANNTQGIGIDDSNNIQIIGNDVINNSLTGISLLNVFSSTVAGNNLVNNGKGLWLGTYSTRNKIYHNSFVNNSRQVAFYPYPIGWNQWDDGYPYGGNYWSDLNDTDLFNGPLQNETGIDGIVDSPYIIDENNQDRYPLTNPWSPTDIIITSITPSSAEVYVGQLIKVSATVHNGGTIAETFEVICEYELKGVEYFVGSTLMANLSANATATLIFNLTTTIVGTYTIKAEATVLPDEANPADNKLTSLVVAKTLGDVNGDNEVDIRDIAMAARAFGSNPNHPRWNPQADINQDGNVDIRDIALIARNYGKTYP